MKLSISTIIILLLTMMSCTENKTAKEKAVYSGNDISDKVLVTRDKNTKKALLENNIPGKWAVYAGSSVDNIDFTSPVAEGEGTGTYALNVNDTSRSYFQIITPESKAILAERHLPMTGGYNFRDLGGYKTTNGKYVKWGKVFRSDDLHNLTDADLKYLSSIPLISIVDFRAAEEIEKAPDKLPASVRERYELSIAPGDLMSFERISDMSMPMDSLMREMNRLLVSDTTCIEQYRTYFKLLQNEEDVPLMFHCSAGKDRTGMGAALFLLSLGVDEDTVVKDYLLSNIYLGDKYTAIITQYPHMKPLMEVRADYLEAGIDEIKKRYGSVDNYLVKTLGVDLDKMKELYLY